MELRLGSGSDLNVTHSYRLSEFGDGDAVGEGVAVAGVVNQDARQEHGAQVVPVQDIHGQGGSGRSSVGSVWSAVLEADTQKLWNSISIYSLFLFCWMTLLSTRYNDLLFSSKPMESVRIYTILLYYSIVV